MTYDEQRPLRQFRITCHECRSLVSDPRIGGTAFRIGGEVLLSNQRTDTCMPPELELIELLPDEEVEALVPKVHADMSVLIDHADPRRREFERAVIERKTMRRPALKQAARNDHMRRRILRIPEFAPSVISLSLPPALCALWSSLSVLWECSGQAHYLCVSLAVREKFVQAAVASHRPSMLWLSLRSERVRADLRRLFYCGPSVGRRTRTGLPLALVVLKPPAGALTAASGILSVVRPIYPWPHCARHTGANIELCTRIRLRSATAWSSRPIVGHNRYWEASVPMKRVGW